MRILTFTSLFPNAVQPSLGVFVLQRVAHLGARPGNSISVVAPVPYFPKWLPLKRWSRFARVPPVETIDELEVVHPRYPLLPLMAMPFHGLLMFFGCLRPVFRAAKQSRFDCIDAHFAYPDGYAAVLFGKLLRVPVVVSARGTDLDLYPSYRVIRPLIRWTLRNASGIIAVSASLKRAILQLGIPEHKVKVIGNGVDTNRFYPVDRLEARQKLGLPKDAQILVTVCALKPVKGLDLLISAAAQLAASYPRLRLYLVGTGPLYAKLMNLASALGVQDRVFLVGEKPNEELKYWFSAADLSCLTSSREGWPNVVSESIACGTPVVAARVGGIPEILSSPKYGVVVERDTHCIARALREALAKEWDREALVRHARERTWAKVAEEVETYLSSLVKK